MTTENPRGSIAIVMVHDDSRSLSALESALEGLGLSVIGVGSAADALVELPLHDPALLVLDIPAETRSASAAEIRAHSHGRTVPLLFVSPRHGDGPLAKAERQGGADDFVGAAIPAELRAKILGFVELHRHTLELERECELQGAADEGQEPPDRSDCRVRVEASALRGEMAADKRMNVRLQLLTGVASDLLRRTAPIEPSDIIATRFVQRLGYDVCVSYLCEPDGGFISIAEAVGIEGPPWSHPRAALDDSPVVRAVFVAQGRYVRGRGDTDALPDWLRALDLPSFAVFPILRAGTTIGALVCGRRDGTEPAPEDLAAIQLVCDQIAMANERDHLNHALVEHVEALALADRRKDEFLAMLAHELRNPLAPMSYALELLHQRDRAPASSALHEVLQRQLSHLSRMVDDLLDVSRITNGKLALVLAPLTVQDAIAHALETSRPQLDKRGHHVVVEVPGRELMLNADAGRIVQVIANLLNNAARYTDPGGNIVVAARKDGAFAVVEVRDDGHGLAPEMLPRVFDLFVQAQRTGERAATGGLGLGLTLVRRLVELHGGKVSAASEGLGRGSTFAIRLPLAVVPTIGGAEGVVGGPALSPRARGLSVLVVEDDEDSRDMLQMLLESRGHRVVAARDGEGGLARLLAGGHDVALLDIGLPGIDGYETARRVRAAQPRCTTRLVAITGYGQGEDRARALAAGFDDHLVKPVSIAELERVLVG